MSGPSVAWCEEHARETGGTRGCLVCACVEMSRALSRIDYMCGPENEMGLSDYDVHCDPARVVERVRDAFGLMMSLGRPQPIIFTKDGHDFEAIVRDQARDDHTCVNTATTTDGNPPPPCAACNDSFAKKNG